MSNWQLPEGIDELTGDQAITFEQSRRGLLDLYQSWGYEVVVPPMIEFAETLVLNSKSIDEKTFKFLDSISGKMLGVHSDITPQIARIDSKRVKSERVDRYCYINAILQTKADDFYASRSPIQAGAELYGFKGIDADIEIITLMIESLTLLGLDGVTLSLGNTSIFNALCDSANLNLKDSTKLRDIFRRKSIPDLNNFLKNNQIQDGDKFKALISLDGSEAVLDNANSVFKGIPSALSAIDDLRKLHGFFKDRNIKLMFDLGEVKAYEYHDGVVFAAYHDSFSKALAQGGRYSGLTKSFGSSRDATGFSFDLKFLVQQQLKTVKKQKTLVAPNSNDSQLSLLINELRSKGHNIKVDLTGSDDVDFVNKNNEWKLKE
ncbi:ATP phosphoribosyltransferase regulatory subunit [Candidatus Pseudothioglobus sp. Uisw_050_01]|uniref:ATP phosphoribosyltransferase regulatory subunit n=1 Tax=Candidatus Pseudothioglobus sp. Uisw_050_01 TaxID=3230997 RepID=UPI003A8AEA7B